MRRKSLLKGMIFDIKRYAIHDGPGIRTTIFFKGCPLHCPWCHNPEGIKMEKEIIFWEDRCIKCGDCEIVCPEKAITLSNKGFPEINIEKCTLCGECLKVCHPQAIEVVGKEMSVEEVMTEIEKDLIFYDQSGGGVTFSGGEPLMQPEFLKELLKRCKERYIHTAVDTTGYVNRKKLIEVAEYVDLFLYDLKLMDSKMHKYYTGVSNEPILENLKELSRMEKNINIRIPVIPGVNDSSKNINKTGEFLASLPFPPMVSLLPYHNSWLNKFKKLNMKWKPYIAKKPDNEKMEEIKHKLEKFGINVKIGG